MFTSARLCWKLVQTHGAWRSALVGHSGVALFTFFYMAGLGNINIANRSIRYTNRFDRFDSHVKLQILQKQFIVVTWEPGNTGTRPILVSWEPGNTGTRPILVSWEPGNSGTLHNTHYIYIYLYCTIHIHISIHIHMHKL